MLSFTKLCTTFIGKATKENKKRLEKYLIEKNLIIDLHTPTEYGWEHGVSEKAAEDGGKFLVYDENIQEMLKKDFVFEPYEASENRSHKKEKVEKMDGSIEDLYKIFEGYEGEELPPIDYMQGLTDEERRVKLDRELKKYYGPEAEYREGQYEAIEGVLRSKKTLVVQKTGWGKSLVYFMSTRLIREQARRITIIISPLLALMNNQIDSAQRLGLHVCTINSENTDTWKEVFREVRADKVDALIISPERLANENFQSILQNVLIPKTGLFVVDEAHCISDWGHDFRPDYRRIVKLIEKLPQNVPVLATTATANDRVVDDIRKQIGQDMVISRGSLMRESIAIQTIHLESLEDRMSWLVEHINELPGTGVIYCLTINDCQNVNDWLNENGIKSAIFTGRTEQSVKEQSLKLFMNNSIKALVATTAFGMGYDKPDIGFVIHFQKPKDIISYYQQIGRAGRDIDKAYAICFYGEKDDVINKYFIENAFPTEAEMSEIVDAVKAEPGLELEDVERLCNMAHNKIKGVLGYLEIEDAVSVKDKHYTLGKRPWQANLEKSKRITELRYKELELMNQFVKTDECYMEFLAKELDDINACKCGKCANCLNHELVNKSYDAATGEKAENFLNEARFSLRVRKQWPNKTCSENGSINIPQKCRLESGTVLSAYSDSKIGMEILNSFSKNEAFSDDIIDAACKVLKDYVNENSIKNITYIPSHSQPNAVLTLAKRLSEKLNLKLYESLENFKDDGTEPQENLNNSYLQWQNANAYYDVCGIEDGNTLLVDAIIRSGWTMTCCGYKLLSNGNGKIFPFALLSTASQAEWKHDIFR